MINERQIDLLVERLIRRIEEANIYFLKKIGGSIAQLKELTPTQAQQLSQILKYGGNYEEIIDEISKYTGLNVKDVDEIFASYAKKDQLFYEKFYRYRNIPFTPYEANMALKTQTMALANIVKNEMYNYTRNNILGYTIRDAAGKVQFMGLRETYNRVLDEALLNVGQGKETFDSAMTRILKDIGGSGLKTLEYESGRSIRLDSAIRMHLKGRLRELHNENQELIGEEIGADGVEISVHANPADDHAGAQGRQFTNEQFKLLQETGTAQDINGKVIDMHRMTKKGMSYSHRPISEMNCYHYVFSVVLGVNDPEYTEKELTQIETNNNKGFNYEGQHYTMYEGTQLQRNIERAIREQKDTQILAKASDNMELVGKTQQKITQLTRKYKELSDISGLPTKMERMKVSGYRRTKVNKPIYTTNEERALTDYISSKSYTVNEKLRNHTKLENDEKTMVRNLDNALNKTPNYKGNIVRTMVMPNPEEFINQLEIGKEYSTNQYLSFSTKKGYHEDPDIIIYVQNAKNAKDLIKINTIGENEVLYQRNKEFITERIVKRKEKYYVLWKEK